MHTAPPKSAKTPQSSLSRRHLTEAAAYVCNTGENGRPFRRGPYTQNGRRRTAHGVQLYRVAEQSERPIRTGEGLSAAVAWKPRRHVASSLEIGSFNEGGLRAAEDQLWACQGF